MAVYYVTISMLTGIGYFFTEKRQRQRTTLYYLAAAFLSLAFLASFRYAIGFDYFSYRNIYQLYGTVPIGNIFRYLWNEPLFYASCRLFSLAGLPYPAFLLVVNLFLMSVSMQFVYRYSRIPWVSVYLYITLQFLAYNMNLIRQSIAVAFFLLAYPYLKSKKPLPYTLLILVGGLFHNSLLFLYPLYFLLPRKHSRRLVGAILALACLGYLSFDPLFHVLAPALPLKYANYQGSYFWNANGLEYVALPALYCLLVYCFRNRIGDPVQRSIYLNSAFYQFVISLFITKHFILERFAIYPFALSLLAIPEIIGSYRDGTPDKKETGTRAMKYRHVLSLFLIFGAAWFCFAAAKGYHRVYPYVSLLDKSLSTPNEINPLPVPLPPGNPSGQ